MHKARNQYIFPNHLGGDLIDGDHENVERLAPLPLDIELCLPF